MKDFIRMAVWMGSLAIIVAGALTIFWLLEAWLKYLDRVLGL